LYYGEICPFVTLARDGNDRTGPAVDGPYPGQPEAPVVDGHTAYSAKKFFPVVYTHDRLVGLAEHGIQALAVDDSPFSLLSLAYIADDREKDTLFPD